MQVGNIRLLLGLFLGDDLLVHSCRAFATYQLSFLPHDGPAHTVLAYYTTIARLVAVCPAWGVGSDDTVATLPGSVQLHQDTAAQSEFDLLTQGSHVRRKVQADGMPNAVSLGSVTRGQAVKLFDFLLHPTDGLLRTLLEGSGPNQSILSDLDPAVVELMTAVYSIACSPCVVEPVCSRVCCEGHWHGFKRAYAAQDPNMCSLHLGGLQALASHKVMLSRLQPFCTLCIALTTLHLHNALKRIQ